MKSRSLGCLEHLVRMEDRSMVKVLFMGRPGGKGRKGGPRKRWLPMWRMTLDGWGWKMKAEGLYEGGVG
jgi:hypothetical protein